ncbi:MAG TPA: DUF3883 domain-containing protein [Rubricoccaceae bacterium]|nr:DUF3883 domain-containing protein [Rubricoccaceae bacterium]
MDSSGKTLYLALADYFDLSEEAREEITLDNGRARSKWENIVRWTREDLRRVGLLVSPQRGVWELTERGRAALKEVEVDEAGAVGSAKRGIDIETFRKRQNEAERIGLLGEERVLESERQRLREAGRQDLAGQVLHVALEDVGAGYDVLSFEPDGDSRYIEVKATRSSRSSFEITSNELNTARRLGASYWLYRVSRVDTDSPLIERYRNLAQLVEQGELSLNPVAFRATWTERG